PSESIDSESSTASSNVSQDADEQLQDLRLAWKAQQFRLKLIIYGLLALWLITVYIMWRQPRMRRKQRKRDRRQAEQHAGYHDARKARRVALQAARNNDAAATREAILLWANETLGATISFEVDHLRIACAVVDYGLHHVAATENASQATQTRPPPSGTARGLP
ncbi:MAG: hypothetical protein AAFN07_07675, partial [Pseudomonadota bacterium]